MIEIIIFSVLLSLSFLIIQVYKINIWIRKHDIHQKSCHNSAIEESKKQESKIKKKILGFEFFNVTSPKAITDRPIWIIPHGSKIGLQHLSSKEPIPCQDSNGVKMINNASGIAVICDGAGSAKNSHIGSQFTVKRALDTFSQIISDNNWSDQKIPSEAEWKAVSLKGLKKIRHELEQFAKEKNKDSKSYACTIIVVIFFKEALFVTHIGDGRAAYQDKEGIWKPLINPHKGDEANQTIFITSDAWLLDNFKMKNILVPETCIITEPIKAFTLMSDGLESHSFELGYFDEENEVFVEKNQPYPKFFDPLRDTILKLNSDGENFDIIQEKWHEFLENGTERLKNEPDDKTLILGVKI
ncbi:hypothetical protein GCM10011344_42770 [Dokdonia pacifica]|uniref:Protein phosphatase 2C n=1 Tax=Dokdonia pacifica TaxID=1627892 RepID=A0A239AJN6_9FLAO|nr:PP2C family serine/threonine-protein phosphatase [Dokdonia pacifica]GGG37395.1 hypothetical protein GCM10011344_42770 [Dokdonia pacifica]SNR95123.1 Protein phosphatase 2C [Dokdonia pacifica]